MWTLVFSIFAGTVAVMAIGGFSIAASSAILAALAIVGFAWLAAEGGVPARRAANIVTGLRIAAGVLVLAAAAFGGLISSPLGLVSFWILAAGGLTDLADGILARRLGSTAFGEKLDAEADAFFILVLTFAAVSLHDSPRWVIAAGLLRYAVALPFFLLPEPSFTRGFSRFAKVSAGSASAALLLSLAPFTPPALRRVGEILAAAILGTSFALEAVIRLRAAGGRRRRGGAAGILRSFLVYYGVPFRLFGMKRLYRRFVGPGELVFDVGAHVGSRIRAFRSLGARVVAVEPQSRCADLVIRLYGSDGDVILKRAACGRECGTAVLRVDPDNPTLATLSAGWIRSINHNYGELGIRWSSAETVKVLTLEELIEEFGVPGFVKLDIEGFEAEALRGLRTPLPALSFEFLPAAPDSALESIRVLEGLGGYRFTYSMAESMRLAAESWMTGADLRGILEAMPPRGKSGDVYAVRQR